MPSISNKQLCNLPATFPGASEQYEVVWRFGAVSKTFEALIDIYKRKIESHEELKQSILRKAFSGQLILGSEADVQSIVPLVTSKPVAVSDISATDLHAGVLALASRRHDGEKYHFGHVKGEKIAHMVEYVAGIDLGRNPIKDAAGPNDFPHLKKVESRAKKAGYFAVKRKMDRYVLKRSANFDKLVTKVECCLADKLEEVDRVIALMAPLSTRQAEILATTYAAWNNLLIAGKPTDNEAIVTEAREDWHEAKLRIPREKFRKAIGWIKEKEIEPVGRGKIVGMKPSPKRSKRSSGNDSDG